MGCVGWGTAFHMRSTRGRSTWVYFSLLVTGTSASQVLWPGLHGHLCSRLAPGRDGPYSQEGPA